MIERTLDSVFQDLFEVYERVEDPRKLLDSLVAGLVSSLDLAKARLYGPVWSRTSTGLRLRLRAESPSSTDPRILEPHPAPIDSAALASWRGSEPPDDLPTEIAALGPDASFVFF